MAAEAGGPLLLPSPPESDWWDKKTLSGPVVVRRDGVFQMFYYGRGGDEWNLGVKPFNPFVPTGRIGMATSNDGLAFQRFRGALPGGALMDPSNDPSAFDAVHVGVGDVVARDNGELWMYYFGGGMEQLPLPLPGSGDTLFRGVRLQTGLAISRDCGLTFERAAGGEPVLCTGSEPNAWDRNGASWPRVVVPRPGGNDEWLMTYHTRESAGFFSAGLATSVDGVSWRKRGKIIGPGKPGSWDEAGISVRHVVRLNDGSYAMFYEGSNNTFKFAIGLATSTDGVSWVKDEHCGDEPGGPVLTARENAWDNSIVGTPYVLQMDDGSMRLYYLGVSTSGVLGIGIALSDGSNFRKWTR